MRPFINVLNAFKVPILIEELNIFSSFHDLEALLKQKDPESKEYDVIFIVDNTLVPDKEDYLREYGVSMRQ